MHVIDKELVNSYLDLLLDNIQSQGKKIMEKLKTRNEYVGCNRKCRFYADIIEATSYGRWTFVKVIHGKVIFNNYNYSRTTSGHQRVVANLMKHLGIKIDLYVNIHNSLTENRVITSALNPLYHEYFGILNLIHTKCARKERLKEIKAEIQGLRELGCIYLNDDFSYNVNKLILKRKSEKNRRAIRKKIKIGDFVFIKSHHSYNNNITNVKGIINKINKDYICVDESIIYFNNINSENDVKVSALIRTLNGAV